VTGYFLSPAITFGTTTLTNAGNYDIFIVKYDASGTVLWATSAGGTNSDVGRSIATDANGNVLVTGYFLSPTLTFGTTTLTNAGGWDMFIVKLGSTTGIEENNFTSEINVSPNPTSGQFQIQVGNGQSAMGNEYKIEIYNVFGEKVTQSVIPSAARNLTIDDSSLEQGIYFLELQTGSKTMREKFVKE
ncbi:MAG: T9SS type A sorting domain-containing protein, partial [Bacteroidetes bacterium]|nr:T9SS type A sorting domain-containing protein [Bacteroidota bacterium]